MGRRTDYVSAKKNVENKKHEEKRSEVLTNRLMFVFVICIILITSMIMIINGNLFPGLYYLDIAKAITLIFALCSIASLIYFIISFKKKVDEELVTFSSRLLLGMSVFSTIIFGILGYRGESYNGILISVIIAATILYFVFYLYNKEFFLFTFTTAVACYCIFFCRAKAFFAVVPILLKLILICVPLFIFVYFFIIRNPKGILKYFKITNIKRNIIPMIVLLILCVISAIVLCLTLDFIFYNILVILSLYLIIGIIYTIKLI